MDMTQIPNVKPKNLSPGGKYLALQSKVKPL